MRRRLRSVMLVGAAMLAVGAAPAAAAREALNAYRVAPTIENKRELARAGFDLIEGGQGALPRDLRHRDARSRALAATTASSRPARRRKNAARRSSAEPYTGSDAQYSVWRRYDKVANDGKEQYLELYNQLEGSNCRQEGGVGTTVLGRDIIALKVTKNAKSGGHPTPPCSTTRMQHAREWLAGGSVAATRFCTSRESCPGRDRRLPVSGTPLVDNRELWFLS